MTPSSRFLTTSTLASTEATRSPATSMSRTSLAGRSNRNSPVDTTSAASPERPPRKTRLPSSLTDWTSDTEVVFFHNADPSATLSPQTTPPFSTATRKLGRATT